MDISTFYFQYQTKPIFECYKKRRGYLVIVSEPFIFLIYGVALRIADIFVSSGGWLT